MKLRLGEGFGASSRSVCRRVGNGKFSRGKVPSLNLLPYPQIGVPTYGQLLGIVLVSGCCGDTANTLVALGDV